MSRNRSISSADILSALNNAKFSLYHLKIIAISGMGFFTDAYDLFSISLLTRLIGRIYYQDNPFVVGNLVLPGRLPIQVDAALSAVALVGTFLGQLVFGFLGDKAGRKDIYGLVLTIMIVAAFGQAASFGTSAESVIGSLLFWRFLLGYGIGGDYPLSAVIASEYGSKMSRGAFIASVFAMQGTGILFAAAVCAIVTACFDLAYKSTSFPTSVPGCYSWSYLDKSMTTACPYQNQLNYYNLILSSCPREADYVWRIVLAFGALPAALTMYIRYFMPETPRYMMQVRGQRNRAILEMIRFTGVVVDSRPLQEHERHDSFIEARAIEPAVVNPLSTTSEEIILENNSPAPPRPIRTQPEHISFIEFIDRYWVQLIGCMMSWLLLDIAFYSQNLFQKDVFLQIGWLPPAKYMSALQETAAISKCQAIVALASTIPGYWVTVFTVDRLGRKTIQLIGFFFMTIFMGALSLSYTSLLNPNNSDSLTPSGPNIDQPNQKNGWIAMYCLCFFFANFGPNATTFILPAELFPTSWKTTAHGICAAAGKIGAIIGAFGFLYLSQPAPHSTSWSFPCKAKYNDLLTNGACKVVANCPLGHFKPSIPNHVCGECNYDLMSGCYPFGIGVPKALGVLCILNFLGSLFTFILPETKGKTLEELNSRSLMHEQLPTSDDYTHSVLHQ